MFQFFRPLTCPGSIDLKDLHGDVHRLEVKVLGTEETWNTPSLILATDTNCNGIAVFSQVKHHSTNSLVRILLKKSLRFFESRCILKLIQVYMNMTI